MISQKGKNPFFSFARWFITLGFLSWSFGFAAESAAKIPGKDCLLSASIASDRTLLHIFSISNETKICSNCFLQNVQCSKLKRFLRGNYTLILYLPANERVFDIICAP
jgi:hypothetical protein